MTLAELKTIRSHVGFGRFLAECAQEPLGEIPRQPEIPSPYAYSPTWEVWDWKGRPVVIVETAHKTYRIFEVPAAEVQPLTPAS